MLGDALWFLLGIALLLGGAEGLVRGGSGLARKWGVSPLVIGLTIVALGTSAPELVVSITASLENSGEVALGNVVGSNTLNTLVVLGITAILYPIAVRSRTVRKDLPLVAAVGVLVWLFAWDGTISRMEGILLLAFVFPYLYRQFQRERDTHYEHPDTEPTHHPIMSGFFVLAGIGALVWGGTLVVSSGSAIATDFGVSERVIALTLVAFGTSAPELATSIVAAARGRVDLAVGNVVGSNLLNIWLVLGAAATTRAIPVPRNALLVDIPVMLIGGLALLLFARDKLVNRVEGTVLVLGYLGYLAWLLLTP